MLSPEQTDKLRHYCALLEKWQKAINLVAPSTVHDAWTRHIEDSLQLSEHIQAGPLIDFGSGAGFPGLVLAIVRPDLDVHLVESDIKKSEFLRTVSRETQTSVTIHNARIEDVSLDVEPQTITARALSSLKALLDYSMPFSGPDTVLIFLKGEKAEQEIIEARQHYNFEATFFPSRTSPGSSIIKLIHPQARCEKAE